MYVSGEFATAPSRAHSTNSSFLRPDRTGLLNRLFQGYDGPAFSIRLWDGWTWSSWPNTSPSFTIVLKTPHALKALIAEPNEVSLGEAFIHCEIDIEGDIFSVFSAAEHLLNRPRTTKQRLAEGAARMATGASRWLRHGFRHSLARDRSSIAYHYDQPVEFFRPWLGETLAYSCAYFRTGDEPLDLAQTQKLEIVCRKLRLQPSDRFLDIGCGWGSLVLHAARAHRAQTLGITLSEQQAKVAQGRITEAAIEGACAVELRDYRDCHHLHESFDKIASVGMVEHVGLRNLSAYFRIAHRLLRPGGVFLNHGIVRSSVAPVRASSFVDRHVFPNGKLTTLYDVIHAAERAGFEVRDVENLREHYERTLRHWVRGLERTKNDLLNLVSEKTYRIWLLYMSGSAAAFQRGDITVCQVLLSKPHRGNSHLPLVREDWYSLSTQA